MVSPLVTISQLTFKSFHSARSSLFPIIIMSWALAIVFTVFWNFFLFSLDLLLPGEGMEFDAIRLISPIFRNIADR